MRTSDIALSLFILIVFVGLYAANILAVGIQRIKDDWPKYRCNPMVMPFAGTFGHEVKSNFVYCIQNMQKNYMGFLLEPLNFNLGALANIGGGLGTALTDVQGFIGKIRSDITSIVGQIFGVFLNMLIQIQKILIDVKDTFGKLTGVMATMLYVFSGSVMTTQSMWKGPPGELVRAMCFHPDTLVSREDGTIVHMKEVEIGDRLKNGATVEATMRIKNFDAQQNAVRNFYRIEGGEQRSDVLVTGSHLIYNNQTHSFVHVQNHPAAHAVALSHKWLSCLVTSDHTIPIGDHVFHDWEDNNGTPIAEYMN